MKRVRLWEFVGATLLLVGALWALVLVDAAGAASRISTSGGAASAASAAEPERLLRIANQDDPRAITFDEYSLGTAITDQYSDRGVVFSSDVFLSVDGANPTAPVLSGEPQFYGDIVGTFTVPGTATPTPVDGFSLDVGFINDRNSVEISYYDITGAQVGATRAQSYGINEIHVTYRGVVSFKVSAVAYEAAGFAIDNLVIGAGVDGIKPTRMAEFGDSYSSGEGLVKEKGLEYDCGTDLHEGRYIKGTNVPSWTPFWTKGSCQTANGSHRKPRWFSWKRGRETYENLCHRHGRAYPNQIRAKLGIPSLSAIFVACSSAVTANIGVGADAAVQFANSPPGVHGGKTQLQTVQDFAASGGPPDLITVGIGGNDAHFSEIVNECIASTCTDPDFAVPVVSTINGTMYRNVRDTFVGLRDAFPDATIAAFGYPSVVDDPANTCFRAFRIGADELAWLKETVLPTVNDAIKDAATEAGVTYVDITAATAGHGVCSAEPWINGVKLGNDTGPFDAFGNESFHPTQKAHDAIADYFIAHYTDGGGGLLFENPEPSGPIRPPTGAEIRLGSASVAAGRRCGAHCLQPTACVQACVAHVRGDGFDPGAVLGVTLQSTPVSLGAVTADETGAVNAKLKLPKGVEAGLHSITLDGTSADGTRQHAVRLLRVYRRLRPRFRARFRVSRAGTRVRALTVAHVPVGSRVLVACGRGVRGAARAMALGRGKRRRGCPFVRRGFKVRPAKGGKAKKRAKRGTVRLGRRFKRRLARRTVVRVVVLRRHVASKSLDVRVRAGKRPKLVRRCLEPGQRTPVHC